MALKIYTLPQQALAAPFTFTVPGQYDWRILSVLANSTRTNQAINTRTWVLSLNDDTTTIVSVPILDSAAGVVPARLMWGGRTNSYVVTLAQAAGTAPLRDYVIPAGYNVVGSIVGSAGSRWTSAALWVDETTRR